MNISELFIRRPVMTTLVMLGILIFGIFSFRFLPVSDLPNVDFPVILVNASLPGASPETMASAVATPLEKEFSTISGVVSMSSKSYQSRTELALMFDLDKDIDSAAQDIQAAISRASSQLPPDMPTLPSYKKVNPADEPIIYIALTSPSLPLSSLNEYGENLMAKRISMISGVAQVILHGQKKYAVRIKVDPYELASRKIGLDEVASAIDNGNVNIPTGILHGPTNSFTLETGGALENAKAYEPLIVAYRDGRPVRLSEVAKVSDSVKDDKAFAWYGSHETGQLNSIVLAIQRQPGTNTIKVANSIKDLIPSFKALLPASVDMHILYDRSDSIRDSVEEIEFTLVLTLALVIMVIFMFLRNLRATIIPSLTLPMAIIGTFSIMYLLGYSVNNLTLMALTLSVGFVVDDAIVMLENIVRHNEMGKSIFQSALDGSKEIGFTILSMTLSLAAVFIPVLFMGGIVGSLFSEFAVTITVAVLVSGFVALTLTPMLSAKFLRSHEQIKKHGRVYNFIERGFGGTLNFYERTLRWSLNHRLSIVAVSIIMLAATFFFAARVPKGFLPSEDRDFIMTFTEASQGISYKSMLEHQQQLNKILLAQPEIESFMSLNGAFGASNSGIIFVKLKPKTQRSISVDQAIDKYRTKLAVVPGIMVFLQNPPPLQVSAEHSKSQYQFVLQSPDTKELYKQAIAFEAKLHDVPSMRDITSDLQINSPQVDINILRDKASSLGLTAAQIENALYYAYGSRMVSTILADTDQYDVIMEVADKYQLDPQALALLYVRSKSGSLVPLSAVTDTKTGLGPLTINHAGQLPAVTISFNLNRGHSIGDAVTAINDMAKKHLPDSISYTFRGDAQAFASSMNSMLVLLVMAIFVIYLVLGILYESYIHPITILTALPFAGFGALLTLWLFGEQLSLYAFVGIIMLIGLVKKNGIMMIDFAIDAQKQGLSPSEAIIQACLIRFRPIMMTTMSALMAGLPIAMGVGAGAESRRPLGLAIVGGLIFSQTLTMYVTPVFYTYMEQLQNMINSKKKKSIQPQTLESQPASSLV